MMKNVLYTAGLSLLLTSCASSEKALSALQNELALRLHHNIEENPRAQRLHPSFLYTYGKGFYYFCHERDNIRMEFKDCYSDQLNRVFSAIFNGSLSDTTRTDSSNVTVLPPDTLDQSWLMFSGSLHKISISLWEEEIAELDATQWSITFLNPDNKDAQAAILGLLNAICNWCQDFDDNASDRAKEMWLRLNSGIFIWCITPKTYPSPVLSEEEKQKLLRRHELNKINAEKNKKLEPQKPTHKQFRLSYRPKTKKPGV